MADESLKRKCPDDFTIADRVKRRRLAQAVVSDLFDDSSADESDPFIDFEAGDPKDGTYFEPDDRPLVAQIVRKIEEGLMVQGVSLGHDDLMSMVNLSLRRSRDTIMDSFLGVRPVDEMWKADVPHYEVDDLAALLKSLRNDIEDETPGMADILKSNTPRDLKKRAVNLHDIRATIPRYSEEYNRLSKEITLLIRSNPLERMVETAGRVGIEEKIVDLQASDEIKTIIWRKYRGSTEMSQDEMRDAVMKKLDWMVSLPYDKVSSQPPHTAEMLADVRARLDGHLFGMTDVKERLLELVNNRNRSREASALIGLVGPPGVGKSAIAKAFAASTGRKFERISLGGTKDSSNFLGQSAHWLGSGPSLLLRAMARAGESDCVILLDEFEKVKPEVMSSFLQILDRDNNKCVKDKYITEFDHDLSRVIFFIAMNDATLLTPPVKDRMELINIRMYTRLETRSIVEDFSLPRALKEIGLNVGDVTLTRSACNTLIDICPTGLRAVYKQLCRILSKMSMLKTMGERSACLSYTVPDFTGFPYELTAPMIHRLKSKDDINTSLLRMYT